MQILSSFLSRAALTITAALALGACSRSEYAMLPKSASYLGTTPVATAPRPAAPAAAPLAPAAAPAQALAVVPAAAAAAPAATTPATPVVAPTPVIAPTPATEVAATVATTAPTKPNLVQRLALKKITKKLDKLMAKAPQLKQHDAAASTARLDSNLRTGLIFLIVGLLVSLFAGVAGIFGVIGAILAIIGLVFIILWLLDQA